MDEIKKKELKLWEDYKYKGDTKAAKELYDSMAPLIHGYTRGWSQTGVPAVAISSFGRQLFLRALDDYDPTKGAGLGTHVRNHLGWRINRFVRTYKNVARVNEKKDSMIKSFKSAHEYLEVKLGRTPSVLELVEELQIPESQVRDLIKSVRKELSASGLEMSGFEAESKLDPRMQESLNALYYEASGEEQLILEYSFGWKGRPKLQPVDISARTGISQPKISQIRKRLAERFERIHGGVL